MLSPRQREQRALQDADIRGDIAGIFDNQKLMGLKVGDNVEFLETPEFSGTIFKISKDQWQNVYIDHGEPGHCHILFLAKLTKMVTAGKATVTRPEKEAKDD